MVKHNNAIPNQHFHKKWARRVKTWLQQPIQKKIRRNLRKEKAAAVAPRPSAGALRPEVHCPTQKYNSKVKLGRGFSLAELKEAGISAKYAKTVGIAVDHRRVNKSAESLALNVERLKAYKARLVVFPKKAGKPKKGDATAAEIAAASQVTGAILPKSTAGDAVSFITLTDELKAFEGYAALRAARTDVKLIGNRLKKSKEEKKKDDAPKDE